MTTSKKNTSAALYAAQRGLTVGDNPRFVVINHDDYPDTVGRMWDAGASHISFAYSLLPAPVRGRGGHRDGKKVATMTKKLVVIVSGVSRSTIRSMPGVKKVRTNTRPTGGARWTWTD